MTNEVGQYELRGILPDTYTLTAEATGFKRYENTGVIVYSQSPRRVDITMEIGELADAITVTEEGARIETDTPAVTYRTPTKEVYYTNVQASLIYTVGAAPGVQNRSELHGALRQQHLGLSGRDPDPWPTGPSVSRRKCYRKST